MVIVGIYRPPSPGYPDAHFRSEIDNILSNVQNKPTVILGDFNCNIDNEMGKRFLKHMQTRHKFHQLVTGPSTWQGSCIDLVFTNIPEQQFTAVNVIANTWSTHHVLLVKIANVSLS